MSAGDHNGPVTCSGVISLKGDVDAFNNLPVEFATHMKRLRNHVDNLSKELISSGYFDLSKESGRMQRQTIIDNIGTYLTRTYEVFDNPNYKPSEAAINVAKNYFTNKFWSNIFSSNKWETNSTKLKAIS